MLDKLEELMEIGGLKKDIILLIISGISLIISMMTGEKLPMNIAWVAIILCGIPIIVEAFIGLVRDHDITADVLVALALIASVFIGEYFAAGEVAFIMQLGSLLEDLTVNRAKASIENLVKLTPRTARILRDGRELIVPAEEVTVGDILRVNPGETVPVDGILVNGQTSINQATLTGESLPVDKANGDEVYSGTLNQYGSFEMKATKTDENSSIQRMIKLVQAADASKAKVVRLADRWAVWIVIIAVTAAILTFIFTHQIIRAVTILVVFCPCALVLATPTAIMAAIGNITKYGFLVREGDSLERLASVKKIAFDKTGTLTYGKPEVVAIEAFSSDYDVTKLTYVAGSIENKSEHPLGHAISRFAQEKGVVLEEVSGFKMFPGKGVVGAISQTEYLLGNESLLLDNRIEISEQQKDKAAEYVDKGCTITWIGTGEACLGFIALADTIRKNAISTINRIKACDVAPILLTGDNEKAAMETGRKAGISDIQYECLPEDKMNYIANTISKNERICMIGDGINDAPALKKATIGIAMGGMGSDIAVDAADIVLVNDKLENLPHLIGLSKHMMDVIKMNLTFSMTLNFVAIVLAITGILNPVVGALVHNAGSVIVIVNSAFLLRWKRKRLSL
ncbi:MAG: cation-translocating P-type ATPase [Pseudobutyrivibrio sp.]|nr:cation-translocating P-type ATPase [Pseudobutyrivibrio sp.]